MKLNHYFFSNGEEKTEFFVSLIILILAGAFITYMILPEDFWQQEAKTEFKTANEVQDLDGLEAALEDVRNDLEVKTESNPPAAIIPVADSVAKNSKTTTMVKKETKEIEPHERQELDVPELETLTRDGSAEMLPAYVEPAPNAFMVVHSFEINKNAVNFSEQLKLDGYEVEIRQQKNGWHSVGIPFNDKTTHAEGLRKALSEEYDAMPKLWKNL